MAFLSTQIPRRPPPRSRMYTAEMAFLSTQLPRRPPPRSRMFICVRGNSSINIFAFPSMFRRVFVMLGHFRFNWLCDKYLSHMSGAATTKSKHNTLTTSEDDEKTPTTEDEKTSADLTRRIFEQDLSRTSLELSFDFFVTLPMCGHIHQQDDFIFRNVYSLV